jgi:DNA-binding response OmpR family regulator
LDGGTPNYQGNLAFCYAFVKSAKLLTPEALLLNLMLPPNSGWQLCQLVKNSETYK